MNAGSPTRLAVLIIGFPAGFAVRIRIAPYDSLFPKSDFFEHRAFSRPPWRIGRSLNLSYSIACATLDLAMAGTKKRVFFGAEFTQVYGNRCGWHVTPADNAVAVPKHA
jgi:hypothetical protein